MAEHVVLTTESAVDPRVRPVPAQAVPMHVWYDGVLVYAVLVIPAQDGVLPEPRRPAEPSGNPILRGLRSLFGLRRGSR